MERDERSVIDFSQAYNVRGEADGDELTGSSVRPLGKKKNSLIRYVFHLLSLSPFFFNK